LHSLLDLLLTPRLAKCPLLHEEIGTTLSDKIMIEKQGLEERLARLKGGPVEKATTTRVSLKAPGRRKYPPVLPKFQNPSNPSETRARQGQELVPIV
jgi:DNA-binding protein H-NS